MDNNGEESGGSRRFVVSSPENVGWSKSSEDEERHYSFDSLLNTSSESEDEGTKSNGLPGSGNSNRSSNEQNNDNQTSPSEPSEREPQQESPPEEDAAEGLLRNLLRQERSPGQDDNSDANETEEIILAMIHSNNQLGVAYYNMSTTELFLMKDKAELKSDYTATKTLIKQLHPFKILTVTGSPESFVGTIKRLLYENEEAARGEAESSASEVSSNIKKILTILSKRDNNQEICRQRVQCLKLESEPENYTGDDRQIYVESLVSFDSRNMVHAFGLLLRYLDRNYQSIALSRDQAKFSHLRYTSLDDIMMVEDSVYQILGIYKLKKPSMFHDTDYDKPIVSLFYILNRCCSVIGERFLRKVVNHPTQNKEELNKRFDVIDFFLKPDNNALAERLIRHLRGVQNIGRIMTRKESQVKVSEWKRFKKTLTNVIQVAELCSTFGGDIEKLRNLAESVTVEMHNINYMIDAVLEFEGQGKESVVKIKRGIDPRLDDLRYTNSVMPEILSACCDKYSDTWPQTFTAAQYCYIPEIGFLLVVDNKDVRSGESYNTSMSVDLEFKFEANDSQYYTDIGCKDLNETYGNIHMSIRSLESKILVKLITLILRNSASILKSIEHCAELDALLSLYFAARDHNYVRPNLTNERVIEVKKGRHPLLDFNGRCVPNDILSGGEYSHIKILTGPNASGKTFYMKQLALITFMAHIGSFVPAESAKIGIVSHILMQMPTSEASSLDLSCFMQSIQQVKSITKTATNNCLVIIDEFGKGTTEEDAVVLFGAALLSFYNRGNDCPHIYAATHIHRVFAVLPEDNVIEHKTFQFEISENDKLVFLYQLIDGRSGRSFSYYVAKQSKLNKTALEKSQQIYQSLLEGTEQIDCYEFNEDDDAIVEMIFNGFNNEVDAIEDLMTQLRMATESEEEEKEPNNR